jgi:type VI secretion system protein VasD
MTFICRSTCVSVYALGLLTLLLTLAGCAGSAKPPEPKSVPLTITAADDLNPRSNGTYQNVDVMVFQLAKTDTFTTADLLSFYPQADKPKQVLGADLLDTARYQLKPGQTIQLDLEVDQQARFIGVVVGFAQIDKAKWRDLVQLRDESITDKILFRDKKLTISIESLSVAVSLGS